jgi:hypothetical protein
MDEFDALRTLEGPDEAADPQGYTLEVREVKDTTTGTSRWFGTVRDHIAERPEIWGSSHADVLQRLENALRQPRRYIESGRRV